MRAPLAVLLVAAWVACAAATAAHGAPRADPLTPEDRLQRLEDNLATMHDEQVRMSDELRVLNETLATVGGLQIDHRLTAIEVRLGLLQDAISALVFVVVAQLVKTVADAVFSRRRREGNGTRW